MNTLLMNHTQLYESITFWALYIIIPIFLVLGIFIGTTAIICPIAWIMGWI